MARGDLTMTAHVIKLHKLHQEYSNRWCAKKLRRSPDWVKKYLDPSFYFEMTGTFL